MSSENDVAVPDKPDISKNKFPSVASVDEPIPDDKPSKEVKFANSIIQHAGLVTPPTSASSSNRIKALSIKTSASHPSVYSNRSSNKYRLDDNALHDILQSHGITAHSEPMHDLRVLNSYRLKHHLGHEYNLGNNSVDNTPNSAVTPNSNAHSDVSPLSQSTLVDDTDTSTLYDNIEEEEHKMNTSISQFTLRFSSALRETQYRIFATERYGTSMRVAILSMIVAYTILACTNAGFVEDTVQVTLVCIGLLIMLITFSIATSFSKVSSSSTTSYLKAIFESDEHLNETNTNQSNGESSVNNDDNDNNNTTAQQSTFLFARLSYHCHRMFALYSSRMMGVSAASLLLLPIFQNTFGDLSDDRFLVYYLLCSLVIASYGSICYRSYLSLSWGLWLLWNILAITVSETDYNSDNNTFDFWGVNVALILCQLVLGHQVKGKSRHRRLSFLRAMNVVHQWNESRTNNLMTKLNTKYNKSPAITNTNNTTANYISKMPSTRNKMASGFMDIMPSTVTMTPSNDGYMSSGVIFPASPNKKKSRSVLRRKSRFLVEMTRDLTARGDKYDNHLNVKNVPLSTELNSKFSLRKTIEESTLGVFNFVRGLGANLAHLDTHQEEDEDQIRDLYEKSRFINHEYQSSQTNKTPHTHTQQQQQQQQQAGAGGLTILSEYDDEKTSKNDVNLPSPKQAGVLQTITSQMELNDVKDEQDDNQPHQQQTSSHKLREIMHDMPKHAHCGSSHELPPWDLSCETYILCGYRINYNASDCCKSLFRKHNETMNMWTEFIPSLIMLIMVIQYNIREPHFWAQSNYFDGLTKFVLYLCMPPIIFRPIISGLAHTFGCLSKKASKIWWKLDFLSIILSTGFASVIQIHIVFFCNRNIQILYIFALITLSFTTTITALTTKNTIIRDLSLGAYFVFSLLFVWFYQLVIIIIGNENKNVPYSTIIYWSISVFCTFLAIVFRASKYPEAFFVKREFKRLMSETYDEKYAAQTIEQEKKDYNINDDNCDENDEKDEKKDGYGLVDNNSKKNTNSGNIVSFHKMLEDMKSFTYQTQNALANIENLDTHLYDDMSKETLSAKKKELEEQIEKLESEIIHEIKHEIQLEECMTEAYIALISNNQRQWFNYLFTSHNFWHIFMNLTVMFSIVAWERYFVWRAKEGNQCE